MKPIAILLLVFLSATSTSAGTWRDGFEDGDFEGWTIQNIRGGISEWKVESGQLVVRRSDMWGSFVILDESIDWKDYEMETDLMFKETLHPTYSFAPINARVSENSSNYNSIGPSLAFNWEGRGGRIIYARAEKGAQDINLVDMVEVPYPVEMNRFYRLKFSAMGDSFRFYIDGTLQREYTFDGLNSGGVAMGAGGCIACFDNVTISGSEIPDGGPGGFAVEPECKLATAWGRIKYIK